MPIHDGHIAEITRQINERGWPPHQAMFYDGRKAIAAFGLLEEAPGIYWSWTIYGKHFHPHHFVFIVAKFREYLKLLDFVKILHIIDKNKPWTRRMIKLFGFSYIQDIDEHKELWGLSHGD